MKHVVPGGLPGGHVVHTFCVAAICWAIWKKRNEACFENKLLRNPIDILIYACALMSYWAGLYGSDMQNKTMDGVKLLLSCANRVLVQQQHPPLLIGPPRSHLEDDDTSTDEAWKRCEHSLLFVLLSSTPMLNWYVKNSTRGRFLGSLGPGRSVVGWYETWKSSHIHPALNLYRYPLSLLPPPPLHLCCMNCWYFRSS